MVEITPRDVSFIIPYANTHIPPPPTPTSLLLFKYYYTMCHLSNLRSWWVFNVRCSYWIRKSSQHDLGYRGCTRQGDDKLVELSFRDIKTPQPHELVRIDEGQIVTVSRSRASMVHVGVSQPTPHDIQRRSAKPTASSVRCWTFKRDDQTTLAPTSRVNSSLIFQSEHHQACQGTQIRRLAN